MVRERSFRTGTVLKFLNTLKGTAFFPIQQQVIKGDADYILCSHSLFVWLELKKDGEEPDPLQAYKASEVRRTGGIAIVARPDNWEEVKRFLQLLDKGIYDKSLLRSIK